MKLKLALVFSMGLLVGVLLSYVAVSLLDGWRASHSKRDISEARALSHALERYRGDRGAYPGLTPDELSAALVPRYLRNNPNDPYGKPIRVVLYQGKPAIVDIGRGGFIVTEGELTAHLPYQGRAVAETPDSYR